MMILATADWVIPVITGAIGLFGVLVGALVGGLVERWQARERDSRNLCIAARLIYDELTTCLSSVKTMIETDEVIPLKAELWAAVRSDLAVPEVDIEDFKDLTIGYVVIEIFNETLEAADDEEETEFLGLLDAQFIADLNKAIKVAAKYAGDDHAQWDDPPAEPES